jgi:hypothetical protein|tara:strand:- start:836 stop:1081 length:246 start_codon:yes stop_codon:yes gene_type:complete
VEDIPLFFFKRERLFIIGCAGFFTIKRRFVTRKQISASSSRDLIGLVFHLFGSVCNPSISSKKKTAKKKSQNSEKKNLILI